MEETNKNYILSKLFLSLQNPTEDGAVKIKHLNLEVVLRLTVKVFGDNKIVSSKVTVDFLNSYGINLEEAWRHACQNTKEGLCIIWIDKFRSSVENTVSPYDKRNHIKILEDICGLLICGDDKSAIEHIKKFVDEFGEDEIYNLSYPGKEILCKKYHCC